jgi:putative ABC transport system permease protein
MLTTYLKSSLRVLRANRLTSFINVGGLSIGLTSCLLIYMFISNELSYDRHHSKKDRIYRAVCDFSLGGEDDKSGMSSFMLSPTLKNDYPEVEEAIRVMPAGKQTMWVDDKPYQFNDNLMSDAGFFVLFDYEFIDGDPRTALTEPQSVVITDEAALKMFGTISGVVGKMIRYARQSYKVTGIVKDQKDHSHLYFNTILSLSSIHPQMENTLRNDWFYLAQANYILFKQPVDVKAFEVKLAALRDKYIVPWLRQVNSQGKVTFHLQQLTSIHLDNTYPASYSRSGNRIYIYIFGALAAFIIIIACINYINLAIATSGKRAKEIGIRKTAGANNAMLFTQFISESVLIALLAVILALLWAHLLLPVFNSITGKSLHVPYSFSLLAWILIMIICIGMIAGAYPALYLSRMQPALVLKSNKLPGSFSARLRKSLVVLQFFISASFMICTIVVYAQMHFIRNKDLGFNKDQVLVVSIPLPDTSFVNKFEVLRQELLQNPGIASVATSSNIPGASGGQLIHVIETPDHQSLEKAIDFMTVSHDMVPIMGMKMVEGRNFSKDILSDDTAAFIVNEAAVKTYGWKDPLNYRLVNGFGYNGKIIGVVKDFHYKSLHEPVQPLVMVLGGRLQGNLLIRIHAGKEKDVIAFVEHTWNKYSKRYPLEYFFMDDNLEKLYRSEQQMTKLFTAFTIVSLLISCLGLYALVTYSLEQRVKEIGIRKVMGASVITIVAAILREYGMLVLVALVCAIPMSGYFMQRWLTDFAYRTDLSVWMFALAGFVSITVASVTISIQTIRAASANPVQSLRYE